MRKKSKKRREEGNVCPLKPHFDIFSWHLRLFLYSSCHTRSFTTMPSIPPIPFFHTLKTDVPHVGQPMCPASVKLRGAHRFWGSESTMFWYLEDRREKEWVRLLVHSCSFAASSLSLKSHSVTIQRIIIRSALSGRNPTNLFKSIKSIKSLYFYHRDLFDL